MSVQDLTARPSHTLIARPMVRKRPIVVALNNDRGAMPSNSKRPTLKKEVTQGVSSFTSFPQRQKKAVALLDKWVKDKSSVLPLWTIFLL